MNKKILISLPLFLAIIFLPFFFTSQASKISFLLEENPPLSGLRTDTAAVIGSVNDSFIVKKQPPQLLVKIKMPDTVELSWLASGVSYSYYTIERSKIDTTSWSEIATTSNRIISFPIADLVPNTDYYYRIKGVRQEQYNTDVIINPITSFMYSEAIKVHTPLGNDSTMPLVSITSPIDKDFLSGVVDINVSATDKGGIAFVSLYKDNVLLERDTNFPYVFKWSAPNVTATTSYVFFAVTKDSSGNVATSTSVTYVSIPKFLYSPTEGPRPLVYRGPRVYITEPKNNKSISGRVETNVIVVNMTDTSKVELYKDNTLFMTDTTEPYTFSWDAPLPSVSTTTVLLQARAYGANGRYERSTQISLYVAPKVIPTVVKDTKAPIVTIISPKNNSVIKNSVEIKVSALDDSKVAKVDLYKNSELFSSDLSDPYEFTVDIKMVSDKGTLFTAKAYDVYGNSTSSQPVLVYAESLKDSTPPKVSIDSPQTGLVLISSEVAFEISSSDDTGVARVDLYKDGVLYGTDNSTPYQYKWKTPEKVSGTSTVKFFAKSYDLAGNSFNSNEVLLTILPVQVSDKPVVSENSYINRTLVVYNTKSISGTEIKDYYINNRPGMKDVSTLGITTSLGDTASQSEFVKNIRKPIVDWMLSHSEKKISYIIIMPGVPSRTDIRNSVDYYLSRAYTDLGIRTTGMEYSGYYSEKFDPKKFAGTNALVTRMSMGSATATVAYIDKLKAMYTAMPFPNVVISAQAAGKGGTSYVLDDSKGAIYGPHKKQPSGLWSMITNDIEALKKINVLPSRIVYSDFTMPHLTTGNDVLGFSTWGANGGLGGNYANDGKIKFTGNSSWYLIKTNESFNGVFGTYQGNYVDWFGDNAFGGKNYSNTPAGAVVHVEEPTVAGVNSSTYFASWEKGLLFAEAAWGSRRTNYFSAIGDPFIVR